MRTVIAVSALLFALAQPALAADKEHDHAAHAEKSAMAAGQGKADVATGAGMDRQQRMDHCQKMMADPAGGSADQRQDCVAMMKQAPSRDAKAAQGSKDDHKDHKH